MIIYNELKKLFLSEKRKQDGFSLIELLVSVVLLGLVTALIYGAFFKVSHSSLSIKSTLDLRQELRLLMKMVLDDLQSVQYLKHFVENKDISSETGIIGERVWVQKIGENPKSNEVSRISFHASVPSRFFQDVGLVRNGMDPHIHEIGYSLDTDPSKEVLQFKRREDFYIDDDIRNGGRSHILSEQVKSFEVEFLFREIEQASGGSKEDWAINFNSLERECFKKGDPPCLPRSIKLNMSLEGEKGLIVSDSQVINLCVRPCKPEIFQ